MNQDSVSREPDALKHPYEAPAVESVLEADDLDREVQYAGITTPT